MSVEILEKISYIAFIFSFLFGVLAFVLYFKMNVKSIVEDLSGIKAERQIRAYREQSTIGKVKEVMKQEENTIKLCEETALLSGNEATTRLSIESTKCQPEYSLVFSEKIIHTGESIL